MMGMGRMVFAEGSCEGNSGQQLQTIAFTNYCMFAIDKEATH